jgi:hypothetical protein
MVIGHGKIFLEKKEGALLAGKENFCFERMLSGRMRGESFGARRA